MQRPRVGAAAARVRLIFRPAAQISAKFTRVHECVSQVLTSSRHSRRYPAPPPRRSRGALVRTPTRHSRTLSDIAGCEICLKFENLQFTACFKERGALNRLPALSAEERKRGVAAMSAGNHAQGVAYHAGRLGHSRHHRDAGEHALQQGQAYARFRRHRDPGWPRPERGRCRGARASPTEQGLTFIHPYDDTAVIAGQGTLGLEMLEDVPQLDTLIVPVGGGGLISGCRHGGERHQARSSRSLARRASFIRRCSRR